MIRHARTPERHLAGIIGLAWQFAGPFGQRLRTVFRCVSTLGGFARRLLTHPERPSDSSLLARPARQAGC
jgi:hypothetical protein